MRPGRPKVPVISRREAVAAALEIIDTDGLEKLSMRTLGAKVGVNGMSLYNHFADKEDILQQVAALVVESIGVPEPPPATRGRLSRGDVAEWSLASALTYRQALLSHPNAIPLFVKGYPERGRHAVFAREFQIFGAIGIDARYWLAIVQALEAITVGSSLFLTPDAAVAPAGAEQPIADAYAASAISSEEAFRVAYLGMATSMLEAYQRMSRSA